MDEVLQKLRDIFDALSARDRSLTILTVLVLIWLVWDFVLMSGLNKDDKAGINNKMSLESRLMTLDEQILKLTNSKQDAKIEDPKEKNEADSLRRKIADIDNQIEALTSGVVKPKEIASVLRSILVDFKGLEIVRMNVLDATPIDEEAITNIKEYLSSKISRLYKHEIEIELHGNFYSTLRYLKKLESFQKVFYWNDITYKSLAWPNAQIILKVYTLSAKEDKAGA